MAVRQSDVPQRVVEAALEMLGTYGLDASSIREDVKRADAPLGSTYHHVPGGKQQLIARDDAGRRAHRRGAGRASGR